MATLKNVKRGFTTQLTSLMIAGSLLNVTPAHALQTEAGDWIPASELHIGDLLRTPTGTALVEDVCTEAVPATPVVSFELEDDLPYFVGNAKVLVASDCNLKYINDLLSADEYKKFKAILDKLENLNGNYAKFIDKLATSKFTNAQIIDLNTALNKLNDAKLKTFVDDFDDIADAMKVSTANKVKAWEHLLKEGDAISGVLRKNIKALEWFEKYGDNIPKNIADNLLSNLKGRQISEVLEDAQKRLVVVTQSTGTRGATTVVSTVEKTANGSYQSFKYTNAYSKAIPPVSANKLAPDFSTNPNGDWLFPVTGQQQNIVRVKLTGKREGIDGDFDLANKAAKIEDLIPSGKWKPDDFTWHHLDDFDPVTGEGTFQLVRSNIHQATVPHIGSVKQYENFTGKTYN